MELSFIKMHGIGNDFVLLDCRAKDIAASDEELSRISALLCHRRFGVGADQILLLYPSDKADFRMRILNADGSEVEMCGNGIRCLAKYIWDRKISTKSTLDIETLAGIIRPERADGLVKVDMGEPVFAPDRIPVKLTSGNTQKTDEKITDHPLTINDRTFEITCVSMGNPHAVIFLDEKVSNFPVAVYGPEIENHPAFPKRTNVEFINVNSRKDITMRVWERGSGETMACGTGASAAGVASMLKNLTEREVVVHLQGGDLIIAWGTDNHVYMTGPAVEVFEGRIKL